MIKIDGRLIDNENQLFISKSTSEPTNREDILITLRSQINELGSDKFAKGFFFIFFLLLTLIALFGLQASPQLIVSSADQVHDFRSLFELIVVVVMIILTLLGMIAFAGLTLFCGFSGFSYIFFTEEMIYKQLLKNGALVEGIVTEIFEFRQPNRPITSKVVRYTYFYRGKTLRGEYICKLNTFVFQKDRVYIWVTDIMFIIFSVLL